MSVVTNVILSIGPSDWDCNRLEEVNKFFGDQRGFVDVEDKSLPRGWYGGSKFLEANLFLGSFNYLLLDDLVDHLATIKWHSRDQVQLIVKCQEEDVFRIVVLPVPPRPKPYIPIRGIGG